MKIATSSGSFELCKGTRHVGTLKCADGCVKYFSVVYCPIFFVFGRPTLVEEQQMVSMMGVLTERHRIIRIHRTSQ